LSGSDFPLVIVAGPTGSGKSGLALDIAETFSGEIVNCDSVQVYRLFDIGTAKLPAAERRGIPHHLMDFLDPSDLFTAGDYSRMGREAIAEITARGHLPVVCGGTGFYLRALLNGLFEGPARDERLRARLARRSKGSLARLLRRLDPVAAARIHGNDSNKLMRALEVRLLSGRPMTELFAEGRAGLEGYRILTLALNPPREELYRRLDERAAQMFAPPGIVEETQAILAAGHPRSSKPFESLGYAQALQFLDGTFTREQAIEATQTGTRQYAKRQWTWFRRERDAVCLNGFGGDDEVRRQALDLTQRLIARD